MSTKPHFSLLATSFAGGPRPRNAALILAGLWLAIFFASLFTPPLLDDADATHAQAAQSIALTGHLVTLRVDGVRYLEKAPLPYWLAALSFRLFGFNAFAAHLPQALAVLLLALLGHRWANQAFGARTAFYTAIATLTAAGTFLFTRILIPEALLSLLLATALFAFLKSLTPSLGTGLPVPHSSQSDEWVHPTTAQSPLILSEGAPAPQSKDLQPTPPQNPMEGHPERSRAAAQSKDLQPTPPQNPTEGHPERSRAAAQSKDLHPTPPQNPMEGHPERSRAAAQSKDLHPNPPKNPTEGHPERSRAAAQSKDLPYSPPATAAHTTSTTTPPEAPAHILPAPALYPYLMWSALALAVLTKGLVALVFFALTTTLYLLLTGETRTSLPKLKPLTGLALFLLIAAPWHILAALHNPATATHPGFVWFYFWNEHVLRFLGRRTPADFNRLPGYLYWLLHLVWLFPWSLFLPLGIVAVVRRVRHQTLFITRDMPKDYSWRGAFLAVFFCASLIALGQLFRSDLLGSALTIYCLFSLGQILSRRYRSGLTPSPFHHLSAPDRTLLLLTLFAITVLLFFSLSTNQEYYTFPIYLPLLLLTAATITRAEQTYASSAHARRALTFAHAALLVLGLLIALTLAWALVASRSIPSSTDLATLLAHRNAAHDTLSLSRFMDLTPDALAALRLPALLAIAALTAGPAIAWLLRTQRRHLAATTAIAFTAALFLIAAHLALARFAPVLSSKAFADRIQQLHDPAAQVLIYGDQAYGSTLPFYLNHPVFLVDGATTSLQFGSTFADVPPIFLTHQDLHATWAHGPRKLLFLPPAHRTAAATLTPRYTLLDQDNKLLLTDRPLQAP